MLELLSTQMTSKFLLTHDPLIPVYNMDKRDRKEKNEKKRKKK